MDKEMIGRLDAGRLRACVRYDPETGIFYWLVAKGRRVRAGQVAGSVERHGYWQIQIDGRLYLANDLAWLYMTGEWPKQPIEQINMKRSDNRWENLKESTQAASSSARLKRTSYTSGVKGVSFDAATGLWRASITKAGKRYETIARSQTEAADWLSAMQTRLHQEPARS
jgi:hypothetical protein